MLDPIHFESIYFSSSYYLIQNEWEYGPHCLSWFYFRQLFGLHVIFKIQSISGDVNTAHMFCCKILGSQHIRNECGHMCQTYPCTQWWLSYPSAWPHFLQATNVSGAFRHRHLSTVRKFYKPWTGEGSPSKLMLNPWAESKI